MVKFTFAFLGMFPLMSCTPAPSVPPAVLADLAPTGTLRAGINLGNPILSRKDPDTGEAAGLAADLARELGRRIGVPVTLVTYDAAGQMTAAVKTQAWDIAFLAIDPGRAGDVSFTAPYIEIEGTYLVPAGSSLRTTEDVDREGIRVAVAAGGTPDLFLTRTLARAQIARAATPDEAVDLFVAEQLDAVGGVRDSLVAASAKLPGSRVLEGRFLAIQQAAGVPRGREAGARYVREFIEDAKRSGLVARLLSANGVSATIAPPAPVE